MTHPLLTPRQRLRLTLRKRLLRAGGVRRIHIVGCARSGTTMLHYSMLAFADTLLIDHEVSAAGRPSLGESCVLCLKQMYRGGTVHLVTKRDFGWFEGARISLLSQLAVEEEIGVLNIVRDPRDVLTSRIPSVTTRRYYVEPDRWAASVRAADDLFRNLEGYPRKLTLRYEDLLSDPGTAQNALMEAFGLSLRPGIESMGRLKDNLDTLRATARLSKHLGEIRNFDPTTAGRWRDESEQVAYIEGLMAQPRLGGELQRFMELYGYLPSS